MVTDLHIQLMLHNGHHSGISQLTSSSCFCFVVVVVVVHAKFITFHMNLNENFTRIDIVISGISAIICFSLVLLCFLFVFCFISYCFVLVQTVKYNPLCPLSHKIHFLNVCHLWFYFIHICLFLLHFLQIDIFKTFQLKEVHYTQIHYISTSTSQVCWWSFDCSIIKIIWRRIKQIRK